MGTIKGTLQRPHSLELQYLCYFYYQTFRTDKRKKERKKDKKTKTKERKNKLKRKMSAIKKEIF